MSGDVLDLTGLLAARALKPRKATFAGIDIEIRRDLTAAEVVEFFGLINADKERDALSMLVGDAAAADLAGKVNPLPMEHRQTVYQRIMREAGALPRLGVVHDEDEQDGEEQEPLGESSAS